jgi:iron complex transport system substrate-binding protein
MVGGSSPLLRLLGRLMLLLTILASLQIGGTALGITVMDEAGRQVEVPSRRQRIVSLAPSITEMLFALGAGNRVVGVTQFSNYPPASAHLPKVGSYVQPNIEKILALRPDLVIAIKDGNPKIVVDRVTEVGVPTFVIDPKSLDGVITSVRNIGRIVDTEQSGSRIALQMSARIREVEQKVSGAPRYRVFFQIGAEPIVSAGRGTFIDILIKTAGGVNITGEMTAYPNLSLEQVLLARPEIILITSMAREGGFERIRRFWSQWPELPAVASNRIHIVNSDILDRPSPRIVDGLEMLARLIHPERFK